MPKGIRKDGTKLGFQKGNIFNRLKKKYTPRPLVKIYKGYKKTEEQKRKISETKRRDPNRFGKYAANWKGGKTRLTQLIRSSFQYRQWRSDIFQRDNYCCMNCGKKSKGDIEAHHLKSLAKIIAERNINNIIEAINCEEVWNINNGLTLCIECHKKTDTYCNTKNGKSKNLYRQL